jgi:hypothetical protein
MHALTAINRRGDTPTNASPVTAPEQRTPKRRTTQLQLPAGICDLEAVTAVISEWLIPLLVKEFLAEQSVVTGKTELLGSPPAPKRQKKEK